MSGQTYIVLIGTGYYKHWGPLDEVAGDLDRFETYASHFGLSVIVPGTREPFTAGQIRDKMPGWLGDATESDDIVVVWGGHGTDTDQHYLVTHETAPVNGHEAITTSNAIATSELTGWIRACRARNIALIVDVCWAGNGAAELAGRLEDAARGTTPDERASRNCEIIVSARDEEAADGAFMNALLGAVHADVPEGDPWPGGTTHLSPTQLVNEINHRLPNEGTGQQAVAKRGYGSLDAFFPRVVTAPGVVELHSVARERLIDEFSEELRERPIEMWTSGSLRRAAAERRSDDPHLAHRLEGAAIALSAMDLTLTWVGRSRLRGRYEQAWRAEMPHRHDIPRTLFDFFEQIAIHSPSVVTEADHRHVVRYLARILRSVGEEPSDPRLFDWAERWGIDVAVVDRMIDEAAIERSVLRLVIDLATELELAEPRVVKGTLLNGDRMVGAPLEPVDIGPGRDGPVAAVAEVYATANRSGRFGHVDVVLPATTVGHLDPIRTPVPLGRGTPVTMELGRRCDVVVRSGERVYWSEYRQPGGEGDSPPAPEWIEVSTDVQEMWEDAHRLGPSLGLRGVPRDPQGWRTVLLGARFLVWHRSDCLEAHHERTVAARWSRFPGCLVDCVRADTETNDGLDGLGAIWDDDEWLELFDVVNGHSLSFE